MKTTPPPSLPESLLNILWLRLLLLASLAGFACSTQAASSITFRVLATFDYPGAPYTWPLGINDANDVAGILSSNRAAFGFIRFHDGSFSDPIQDPNDSAHTTLLTGINNFGVTSGWYLGTEHSSGFVRSADGTFTPFDLGTFTQMGGINDDGNLCGQSGGDAWISIGGTVTTFTIPRSRNTFARGINNLNQCVGSFLIRSGYHGFRRDADGTLVYPIDASNATETQFYGINDRGEMVGYATDATGTHAVFFGASTNATFDYPGAVFTRFDGINSKRVIVGDYIDSDGFQHGFLVKAKITQTDQELGEERQ